MSDLERRDFCRILTGCTLLACTGGLAGCARLLDWSAGTDAGRGRVATMAANPPVVEASSTVTPSETVPAPALPDLAVYTGDDPAANVRAAVAALGGMDRFVKRGARVVIKPNVIVGRAPELATTTNPIALAAVVTMAYEAGAAQVTVLDRPTGDPRTAFEGSGIAKAVNDVDGTVKILSDRNFERFDIPKGRVLTSWPLVTDIFEADTFINMPIAKTHSMAGLTMSMKNLMGVMGGTRGTVHQDFHQKIVDLATLVQPHLVILDAYRIMIRNGPTGGSLKDVRTPKTAIAGTNMPSVDAYGATLFGKQASDLKYLVNAGAQGLGVIDLNKLDIAKGTT
ncbi:MAG: cytoplasmic protein [Actinobacteria bacterium HGW-Actinobacteria-1]|jgi:uncharacterized protein (DUF362 family)|nr:MAG: cytoplasmic protein [Actinobacteria bacterium HGW-Actinobacteria-1]